MSLRRLVDCVRCIVTELVEDADLFRNVLINGELPTLEQTREWFVQMFLALEWLHHFDLYHRDLKLENIFVSKARNLVKIGDMGLAAFSHPQDLFSKGCGTMYYMSPEIILVRSLLYSILGLQVKCVTHIISQSIT